MYEGINAETKHDLMLELFSLELRPYRLRSLVPFSQASAQTIQTTSITRLLDQDDGLVLPPLLLARGQA